MERQPRGPGMSLRQAIRWQVILQLLLLLLFIPLLPLLLSWRWGWWQAWVAAACPSSAWW